MKRYIINIEEAIQKMKSYFLNSVLKPFKIIFSPVKFIRAKVINLIFQTITKNCYNEYLFK